MYKNKYLILREQISGMPSKNKSKSTNEDVKEDSNYDLFINIKFDPKLITNLFHDINRYMINKFIYNKLIMIKEYIPILADSFKEFIFNNEEIINNYLDLFKLNEILRFLKDPITKKILSKFGNKIDDILIRKYTEKILLLLEKNRNNLEKIDVIIINNNKKLHKVLSYDEDMRLLTIDYQEECFNEIIIDLILKISKEIFIQIKKDLTSEIQEYMKKYNETLLLGLTFADDEDRSASKGKGKSKEKKQYSLPKPIEIKPVNIQIISNQEDIQSLVQEYSKTDLLDDSWRTVTNVGIFKKMNLYLQNKEIRDSINESISSEFNLIIDDHNENGDIYLTFNNKSGEEISHFSIHNDDKKLTPETLYHYKFNMVCDDKKQYSISFKFLFNIKNNLFHFERVYSNDNSKIVCKNISDQHKLLMGIIERKFNESILNPDVLSKEITRLQISLTEVENKEIRTQLEKYKEYS